MKRELFVFAGQSNMMGASVFPPQKAICISNSYEYKHKPRRLGEKSGDFVIAGYPVGEFAYKDLIHTYAPDAVNKNFESYLRDYQENTYFCPSMSNLMCEADKTVHRFTEFSEATAPHGVTLAPFLAEEWEKLGNVCAYAHIAKGGVSIDYYFTDEMTEEYSHRIKKYNKENGTNYKSDIPTSHRMEGASEYFFNKCRDFFFDSEIHFAGDDISNKCFFWLQGESDVQNAEIEYKIKMEILWESIKPLGFTHFFCIRVDYFGSCGIHRVMKAQENFVAEHSDTYMLTRAASYFTYPGQNEDKWFISPPDEEYRNCRDSFYGYNNQHINEKGFSVIASHASKNLYRVLIKNEEPLLETENIKALIGEENV